MLDPRPPTYARPGIRYGRLTAEQLARMAPQFQTRLPDRAMQDNITGRIADAGSPELRVLADPVLGPEPQSGPGVSHVYDPLKYTSFSNVQLTVGAADILVLPQPPGEARRVYLFIINTHPLQDMFVAFQVASSTLLGVPIEHNFGFFEFNITVPQDDVHLIASGAGTTGVLLYGNKIPNAPNE